MIAGLRQDWGETETPLLEGTHKVVCASGLSGRTSDPHRRLNQTYLLVLEGRLQRWGGWLWLTEGTRTLTAEVLGSTPWREPSHSLPLAPPKSQVGSRIGSPQTKQPTGRELSPTHQKACTSLLDNLITKGQTAEERRTTILQPVEQKPHSQKDRQDEKAEGYVPDEEKR